MTTDAHCPFVSVIVPARDAEGTLSATLRSVLASEYPADRREVIVVDNGSRDRTSAIAAQLGVSCVHEPREGRSRARNRGIEQSRGSILAFIDADCVATARWLPELVAGFDDDSVGAVAGEIFAFPPTTPAERYAATRHTRWQRAALDLPRPYPVTANVAFRREVFARIGLFDPRFETAEDKDLGWRFFADGMELRYRPTAAVLHRHRRTARELFAQHAAWGRGAAALHAKYGIPWQPRHELHMFAELLGGLVALGSALARRALGKADRAELERSVFEVLRKVAQRIGAIQGLLANIRTRGQWSAPGEARS